MTDIRVPTPPRAAFERVVTAFSPTSLKAPPRCVPVDDAFHRRPDRVLVDPVVEYINLPSTNKLDAQFVLATAPLPKGAQTFSSFHVVVASDAGAASTAASFIQSADAISKNAVSYTWPQLAVDDIDGEYAALFDITSNMILKGADRTSLLVFIAGSGSDEELAVASILGMLPFRGVQVVFVTPSEDLVDPMKVLRTASGLFEYSAEQPGRMGRAPVAAIYGPLPSQTLEGELQEWKPLHPDVDSSETKNPFKIGGLELPMVTFSGRYSDGVDRLADLLVKYFGQGFFPVCAVGETGDSLGYGSDIQEALATRGCPGHYFAHKSTESSKHPHAYGKPELLAAIHTAKKEGRPVAVIAVGGGVNGNAMGMIAALTGVDFVEIPTTLMHYNDATTSAKKAFSLVVNGQILTKNILGTFYLPKLVFCISECFLTLCISSVHAAVGEASKTMSMLGKASTGPGQKDFHNILGASEFAGDFTRIITTAHGFEKLIEFIIATKPLKKRIMAFGQKIRAECDSGKKGRVDALKTVRRAALTHLRKEFQEILQEDARNDILAFLTVINEEVIKAKAMFLAYSDPFEKYRALLFEYAHTLGHGVEAFMNGLYRRAESQGIDYTDAFRLHGQFVGMAVIWAGEMSREMGHLKGDGYMAHQALVYLFNKFGGFDFMPLRRLMDQLGVTCDEFTEGVLRVVRRDNKRGYCKCAEGASVDQLVRERPGCLIRSADPSAELRYLVEVSEASQLRALERAYEGQYDSVLRLAADSSCEEDRLRLVPRDDALANECEGSVSDSARALGLLLKRLYENEEETVDSKVAC